MPKPRHSFTKKRFKELFGGELITARGKQPRRLSPKELEAAFGIRPQPQLRPRQKVAAKAADEFFLDMYWTHGVASLDVFRDAAAELHSATLHNLSECPEFVLAYMRRQLEPARVEALRKKTAEKLRSRIERTETHLRRLT